MDMLWSDVFFCLIIAGVLMVGSPGVGKTLLAKATAGKVAFFVSIYYSLTKQSFKRIIKEFWPLRTGPQQHLSPQPGDLMSSILPIKYTSVIKWQPGSCCTMFIKDMYKYTQLIIVFLRTPNLYVLQFWSMVGLPPGTKWSSPHIIQSINHISGVGCGSVLRCVFMTPCHKHSTSLEKKTQQTYYYKDFISWSVI